ncbi:RrF2 family transcriptional regulator [Carboxydothermus hydrogenoformans]|uniref:Rrf2 family protein n=1 Tax=Carboxydothermus hydrogenoformans (strain ATCC BAA-161 / DSM 6008 / Z-2901) TaxID=246194 RepID=Q3AF22_CARHZ|nr:Rrf2 family transcriptional regulator [Carboxydothermus hydrogenoformans]ABB14320.1 rrf2 family protein [Carboxydothermus hydrogenoformans Z-2901]
MQLTKQGEYALIALMDLAKLPKGQVVPVKTLAERLMLPEAFLAKIVQSLVKAGLVYTVKGPQGGVALLKDPEKITVLEVVEAVEGPIVLSQCINHPDICEKVEICPLHKIWHKVQQKLIEEFSSHNLLTLSKEGQLSGFLAE